MEFTFTATPELGPKAMRYLLRRRAGVVGPAAMVLLPVLLLLIAQDPAMRPFAYVIGGAAATVMLIFLLAVALRRKQRDRFFAMASDREIHVTVDDEGLAVRSALGSSRLAWIAIERVWAGPEVVLVFFHGWQYVAFPAAAVPADALLLMTSRARRR